MAIAEIVRPHGVYGAVKARILQFEEIRSRDGAEALRGAFLEIDANARRRLPAGSFYIHEIAGLEVVSLAGELLGTIKEVLKTGANDVYVVNREKGKEILIPATREVVRSVDLEAGRMTVAMIPGLVEEEE
ncbi:MAG: 16S rRNA processing protein RimM [Armatimonadetes bacterium]|nr:16S rRNA processing protein RimM [Armatimonadota bacterium]